MSFVEREGIEGAGHRRRPPRVRGQTAGKRCRAGLRGAGAGVPAPGFGGGRPAAAGSDFQFRSLAAPGGGAKT